MSDIFMRILISAQDSASSIIKNLSNSFGSGSGLVGVLAVAGTAAIGFGAASVKAAADFQQSMLQSQALAGVTADQAKAASAAILQMAVDVGQSPKTLADGLYYIASAGYSAKDSLTLLKLSATAAAVGNTSTEITANALTSAMKAFNIPASQAGTIMDQMTKTVSTGKTEFEDYATVIGKISINAKQAGITFTEANAAFATLTNVMPSSKQAADSLNALMQTSSRVDILTSRAKSLGLAFDTNAYQSMNFAQRLAYLKEITGGNQEEMSKLLGRQNAVAAATILLTNKSKDYEDALKGISNAHGTLQQAFEKTSQGFNQQMARVNAAVQVVMITIGSQLLPILTSMLSAIAPIIAAFASWAGSGDAVGRAVASVKDHAQIAMPVLAGLGAMILTILVPAVASLAAGVILATWPILAIGAAVAGLVAIFVHFYQTNAGFKTFVDGLVSGFQHVILVVQNNFMPVWNSIKAAFDKVFGAAKPVSSALDRMQQVFQLLHPPIKTVTATAKPLTDALDRAATLMPKVSGGASLASQAFIIFSNVFQTVANVAKVVWPVLQGIGAFLQSTFKPVWDQLAATFQGELVPAWKSLVQAIQPLMPQLKMFAQFLGGAVLVAITLVISVLGGLIGMFAGLLKGVIQAFAGIVSIITGALKIASGIIAVFIDLATGKFGNLSKDLGTIMDGVGTMFHGIWETIKGIWNAAIGAVVGFCQGFGTTISGIFQNLSNLLVGHSIIPDMINSIVSWFQGLPGKAGSAVSGILGTVGSIMSNLLSQAVAKAQSIVSGIGDALGRAGAVAGSALSSIPGIVSGALSNAVSSALSGGASIVQGIADGISGAIGSVTSAIGNVVATIDSYLPHSPAKKGPLSQLNKYGKALVETFSNDIKSHSPKAQAAAESMIGKVAKALLAFPKQIAYADLHGNKAEVAKLKAERLQDELLMKKYRDIITIAGYKYQTGNLNDLINFTKKTTSTPAKTVSSGVTASDLSWLQAQLRQIITILGAGLGIDTRSNGGGSSIPFYLENPSYSASGRGGLNPGQGGARGGSGNVINIYINTMARSQSEVKKMVDMIEDEIGRRFRNQTPGYSTGGIF